MDQKSTRIYSDHTMDVRYLQHIKIPCTIYGTSTLLHGKYHADIWPNEYVLQRTGILGEKSSVAPPLITQSVPRCGERP